MPRTVFLVLLTLALPLCTTTVASVPQEEYEAEVAGLEGTWRVTYWKYNGQELSADREFGGPVRFLFTKDMLFTLVGKRRLTTGTRFYKLHPERQPATIDYFTAATPGTRPISRAIYLLRERRLTICAGSTEGNLPKAFASKPGTNTSLVELVREK